MLPYQTQLQFWLTTIIDGQFIFSQPIKIVFAFIYNELKKHVVPIALNFYGPLVNSTRNLVILHANYVYDSFCSVPDSLNHKARQKAKATEPDHLGVENRY